MVLDGNKPVEQCGMCGHSLVIHSVKNADDSNKTIDFSKIKLYQNNSQNVSATTGEPSGDLMPSSGDVQVFAIS